MDPAQFLSPVLALIGWTLVMWVWLFVRRIPAMGALSGGATSDDVKNPGGAWKNELPLRVQAPAHNYNHLLEQPTIFYALMFYCAFTAEMGAAVMALAWAYVGLRIVHSLVQGLAGPVLLRFALFALSTLCLFGMTFIAAT